MKPNYTENFPRYSYLPFVTSLINLRQLKMTFESAMDEDEPSYLVKYVAS